MTDKERILMVIITRIIPGLAWCCHNDNDRDEYIKGGLFNETQLIKGDLVYANTSIYPNDFCVGFIEETKEDCVVIREIGSDRLTNYYNESFTKINRDKIGYEILEGVKYKTYKKVLKAFSDYTSYGTRFKSISFDGDICTVEARSMFSNDVNFEVEFTYNSKTTIKSIGKLLEEKDE